MDRIIQQILKIDADAKQKLKDARQRREELISQADEEAAREVEKLRSHSEEKIEMVRRTEEQNANDQIAEIRRKTDEQIAGLEKHFAEKEPEWLEEIVQRVIG